MSNDTEIIDRGRGPEIKGTRITVYDILDYHTNGVSPEEIASILSVSIEQVLAAVRYVEQHEADVMAVYRDILEFSAQGNPPEVRAALEKAHEKLMARRRQLEQEKNRGMPDARAAG